MYMYMYLLRTCIYDLFLIKGNEVLDPLQSNQGTIPVHFGINLETERKEADEGVVE